MRLLTDSQWERYFTLVEALAPLSVKARYTALHALRVQGQDHHDVLSLVALYFALPPEPERCRRGERIGQFTLGDPIASGGMGVVYRARQDIGREVALKLIHPALMATGRDDALERFADEMTTLAKLEHAGIARIYDGGLHREGVSGDTLPFFAMQLVQEGMPLTVYAKTQALSLRERLELFLRVCDAVLYAHTHAVVHRDLKPANILVDAEGHPFVIDFGLAQACNIATPRRGQIVLSGTPAYMSPEQVADAFGLVSPVSDVYALGVILYELLAGRRPYEVPYPASPDHIRRAILDTVPPPLGDYAAAFRGTLTTINARALEKQPAARYPSVAALQEALRNYLKATETPWPGDTKALGPFYLADNRLVVYIVKGLTGQAVLTLETHAPELAAAALRFTIGDEAGIVTLPPNPTHANVWRATHDLVQSFAAAMTAPHQFVLEHSPPAWRVVTVVMITWVHTPPADDADRLGTEPTQLIHFRQLVKDTVRHYDGHVWPSLMDEDILVFFGVPQTHENDAERALLAALAIRRTLSSLAQRVTMGIATERSYYDPQRDDVHAADLGVLLRSLQTGASPGTIRVGESTYRATRQAFQFRSCQQQSAVPPVYDLLAPVTPRQRPPQRRHTLVGRQQELATLHACLADLETGTGHCVALLGEAGIGKSRLVAEIRQQVGTRVHWLESHALSYTHTLIYGPFQEILRQYADISAVDDEHQAAEKLVWRLTAAMSAQATDIVPYLLQLASVRVRGSYEDRVKYLTPEALGRQIFHAAWRFFARLASERPLVLILENWHRRDHASAELLAHLLPLIHQVPLLIWMVCRPESEHTERWQQLAADRYHRLTLAPLSPAESAQLLDHLSGDQVLVPHVRSAILSKAKGNPFFLEELMVAYAQQNADTSETPLNLPDTIETQILARFYQLPERFKETLHVAAVIGRSFTFQLMHTVIQGRCEDLEYNLSELQRLQFLDVYLPSAREYMFKHDLLQEAIYQHMLTEHRQALHRRVGDGLERLYADRLEGFASHLAYHFAQATAWEQAKDYLLQAGDRARQVASNTEALQLYQQVIDLLGNRLEAHEWLSLQRKMGEAFYHRGEHHKAEALLHRALAMMRNPLPASRVGLGRAIAGQYLRHLGSQLRSRLMRSQPANRVTAAAPEHARIYELLVWIAYSTGQRSRFVLYTLMALKLAERRGLLPEAARCYAGLGASCDFRACFWLAELYHGRAVSLAAQVQHPLTMGLTYFCLACHKEFLGAWEHALLHYRRSAEIYHHIGDPRGWGTATTSLSRVLTHQGNFTQSMAASERLIQVGQEGGDPLVWGWGMLRCGDNLLRLGALDAAAAHLQRACTLLQSVPDYHTLAEANSLLARCYLLQGKLSQALAIAEACQQRLSPHGSKGSRLAEVFLAAAEQATGAARVLALQKAAQACQAAQKGGAFHLGGKPRAWRLRGTYAWLRGKPATARKWWHQSLRSAEQLGARWELGMTHLEMGQRLQDTAHLKRAEAILTKLRC